MAAVGNPQMVTTSRARIRIDTPVSSRTRSKRNGKPIYVFKSPDKRKSRHPEQIDEDDNSGEIIPLFVNSGVNFSEYDKSLTTFTEKIARINAQETTIDVGCKNYWPENIDEEIIDFLNKKQLFNSVMFCMMQLDPDDNVGKEDPRDGEIVFPIIQLSIYEGELQVGYLDYTIIKKSANDRYGLPKGYTRMSINFLHVDKSKQGKGIASLLMGYALVIALAERCHVIKLDDDSENAGKVVNNIYNKFGFKFLEPNEESESGDYVSISDPEKYLLLPPRDEIFRIIRERVKPINGGKRKTKKYKKRKSKKYNFMK